MNIYTILYWNLVVRSVGFAIIQLIFKIYHYHSLACGLWGFKWSIPASIILYVYKGKKPIKLIP